MASKTAQIISYLDNRFPQDRELTSIHNCQDINFKLDRFEINQYIIGVTPADRFTNGIDSYERHIKEQLADLRAVISCVPWPFDGSEIDEMRACLSELSEHYHVALEIDKMISGLKVQMNESGTYYIVITVVQYNVVHVE